MVAPLQFLEDGNRKSHHRAHSRNFTLTSNVHNDEAVDIEKANYIDNPNTIEVANNDAIEVADGLNSQRSKQSIRSESKTPSKRQTKEVILLTAGSTSSCKCVLLPHGEVRTYWDLYISFLLLYVGAFVPYRVSFLGDLEGLMKGIELFVDISFGVDIILNFMTGKLLE